MLMKVDVILKGLHPVMRVVLREADRAFQRFAKREAIITSALDGSHSPGSWHYVGLALDFRTNDLQPGQIEQIRLYLVKSLPEYDVVVEGTHIHIEVSNELAQRLGLMP